MAKQDVKNIQWGKIADTPFFRKTNLIELFKKSIERTMT